MTDNKFLELTSSPLMNLDHTYRYSGTKLVEPESLSQHIVDTIMMGLKVIDEINHIAGRDILDRDKYLMKAVCHDLEEVITGDIPRPLKYYNEDTTKSMKEVADQVAIKFFNEQFHESDDYYAAWRDAKEDKEGYILKIVDTLVVAHKVLREVALLNNYYMLRVAHEVSHYITNIRNANIPISDNPEIQEYIDDLLYGSLVAMNDLLIDHTGICNKFNIYNQSMI